MNRLIICILIFLLNSTAIICWANQPDRNGQNDNIQFSLHPYVSPKTPELDSNTEDNDSAKDSKTADGNLDITESDKEQIATAAPGTVQRSEQRRGADGSAEKTVSPKLLQGQVVYTVPSGTPVKLKLATVPSHPIKLMNHDLDGNLYPARLGQTITAKTTEDLCVGVNKIIPEGTIFSGTVSKILPPRRVGRPGWLVLSFNEFTTPDGQKFAFHISADNFKPSTAKTKAKGFGIIAYHAAGGAIVGALVAYKIFGLHNTIAMHGYNIAGGAAAGALIATGYAIMRKGPKATLEPGDDLRMTIDSDLAMPLADLPAAKISQPSKTDLKLQVKKSKIVSDGLGEHFVTVDAIATNDSEQEFSTIDLFLEDSNQDKHPVCSSPDENAQFLFRLQPHSTQHLHLSFLTPYPKLEQELVWLDHDTKMVVARQTLKSH
jgi:hypothetical protein